MAMPMEHFKGENMEHLLQNLPNGGAVVAIVVVVILFLKEIRESRHDYLDHLKELMGHQPKPRK